MAYFLPWKCAFGDYFLNINFRLIREQERETVIWIVYTKSMQILEET